MKFNTEQSVFVSYYIVFAMRNESTKDSDIVLLQCMPWSNNLSDFTWTRGASFIDIDMKIVYL